MKRFFICLLVLTSLFCLVVETKAINFGIKEAGYAAENGGYAAKTSDTTLSETVGLIIKIFLSLSGVIFLGLTVYAGYLWMTARGEEGQIEKAKKMITACVIGLIITVAAYSLTDYVLVRVYSSVSPKLINK